MKWIVQLAYDVTTSLIADTLDLLEDHGMPRVRPRPRLVSQTGRHDLVGSTRSRPSSTSADSADADAPQHHPPAAAA